MKLLIVGFSHPAHMGGYLASAAKQLGLEYRIMDAAGAEATNRITRSFHWRFRGKRPARLADFGAKVVEVCAAERPSVVLATGRAPLDRSHIESIRALGAKVVNYSTDDPWNRILRAPWFDAALPSYDAIFTPRRANIDDFRSCGVRVIHYMPFGYDPEVHRPWPENAAPGRSSDVLFVGGCDGERLPLIYTLIDAGFNLALFGGFWNRHLKTRPFWRGLADQNTIRAASAAASVCLCLVRRANRDGHVMRSFEAAAIGGCLLAEDTADHRDILGVENHAARYFRSDTEMVQQANMMVADSTIRLHLQQGLRERMDLSDATYASRLASMLRLTMETDIGSGRSPIS
jgi:spore maturation protein CgeB